VKISEEKEANPERDKERRVGGMTYKPIELRPLGGRRGLRAENQEENGGVNALNRRHKRRIPLSVWVAVAVLVLVLFGCIATIAYVNLYGDSPDEKEEEEEKRSWAVVLGGRGDTFDRHIEVVDLGEGCVKSPPNLPPLPKSLDSGDFLKSSFQPEQGLLVCGNLQPSCFLLSSGSSQWNQTDPQDVSSGSSQWNQTDPQDVAPWDSNASDGQNRTGAAILTTERGTYMLGGSRVGGQLAESILKWDPGVKRWQQGQRSLAEGRINPAVAALPCSFQTSQAPPKFHRLLDMKPFT